MKTYIIKFDNTETVFLLDNITSVKIDRNYSVKTIEIVRTPKTWLCSSTSYPRTKFVTQTRLTVSLGEDTHYFVSDSYEDKLQLEEIYKDLVRVLEER